MTTFFEIAWAHYRVTPSVREQPQTASLADRKTLESYNYLAERQAFHDSRTIKCVAVWDTVGSYGIPAGIGLAPLARYFTLITLGFHDTSFGDHIDVGLHAIAVDEHRRPFVPTFWTVTKGQQPRGHVEQTWFAGAHSNVGGGYSQTGLSDQALVWMIARVRALTNMEFDIAAVRSNTKANIAEAVVDSTEGWVIDHTSRTTERFCRLSPYGMVICSAPKIPQKNTSMNACIGAGITDEERSLLGDTGLPGTP